MGLMDMRDSDRALSNGDSVVDISYSHDMQKSMTAVGSDGRSQIPVELQRSNSAVSSEVMDPSDNGCSKCENNMKPVVKINDAALDCKSIEDDRETVDLEEGTEEEEEKEVNPVPIDRGWAWFVLLGAVMVMTLAVGMQKSSGIVFIAIQQRFDSSSSATSLISTVQNAVFSVSAVFVMTIGTKLFSRRKLVFVGGIMVCVAYLITSQAKDIRILLFSHGVLQGISLSFIIPNTMVMVGTYFHERRGFANSVAVSGGSLGGLIFAPLITNLLESYSYQGCFLIISGLLLNICVSGTLYRPQTFYTKDRKKPRSENQTELPTDVSEKESLLICNNGTTKLNGHGLFIDRQISQISRASEISSEYSPVVTRKTLKNKLSVQSNGSITIIVTKEGGAKNDLQKGLAHLSHSSGDLGPRVRQRTFTETSVSRCASPLARTRIERENFASKELVGGSFLDVTVNDDILQKIPESDSQDESIKKQSKISILKNLTKLLDFKLFKRPLFVVLMFSAGLNCAGNALSSVYIAPYANEVGLSASEIAQLLTIYSAIDLCARIAVGIISDRNWVRRSTIIAVCSMVTGCAAHLVRYYTSFPVLVVYAVTLGLFSGVYFSLFAVTIVDYMTLQMLQPVLGFSTMFHGITVAFTFYFAGYLRDVTGTYVTSFHFLGAMAMTGAVLMSLLPVVERMQKVRELEEEEEEDVDNTQE